MIERWIEHPIYSRYSASNLGRIFDAERNRVLTQTPDRVGYLRVKIWYAGERKTVSVHRFVVSAFFDVDEDFAEVNHIDGDKSNNKLFNLEVSTRSENMKHAYRRGLVRMPKETRVRCVETGEEFRTMRDAARHLGASDHKSIARVLDNPNRKAFGFRFESV